MDSIKIEASTHDDVVHISIPVPYETKTGYEYRQLVDAATRQAVEVVGAVREPLGITRELYTEQVGAQAGAAPTTVINSFGNNEPEGVDE